MTSKGYDYTSRYYDPKVQELRSLSMDSNVILAEKLHAQRSAGSVSQTLANNKKGIGALSASRPFASGVIQVPKQSQSKSNLHKQVPAPTWMSKILKNRLNGLFLEKQKSQENTSPTSLNKTNSADDALNKVAYLAAPAASGTTNQLSIPEDASKERPLLNITNLGTKAGAQVKVPRKQDTSVSFGSSSSAVTLFINQRGLPEGMYRQHWCFADYTICQQLYSHKTSTVYKVSARIAKY